MSLSGSIRAEGRSGRPTPATRADSNTPGWRWSTCWTTAPRLLSWTLKSSTSSSATSPPSATGSLVGAEPNDNFRTVVTEQRDESIVLESYFEDEFPGPLEER
jgi:hypothetical protein